MASKVQICNLALSKITGNRITSLTDNTIEAKLCNAFFDDLAEETMAEGQFSSTIKRANLARTTNTPEFGFDYEFQLPTNPVCLKVISINEETLGNYEYRVEGNKLLANVSTMKIVYVSKISDTQSYGPFLKRALVSRLASELARPLTGNGRLAQELYAEYKRDLLDGMAVDGQQGSAPIIQSGRGFKGDVR